jgi:hypothetical protein
MRTLITIVAVAVAAAAAAPAYAVVVGGSKGKSDCYAGLDVTANGPILTQKGSTITAGACSGSCTFTVKACVGLSGNPKCTPTAITSLASEPTLPNPATLGPENACGAEQTITVTLPGKKKKATAKVKLTADAPAAKPKKDKDKIKLICKLNNPVDDQCGGNIPVCPTTCANPDGGPSRLVLTIANTGTDLDNGWTGNSHNFPLVPGGVLDMCLTGCNETSDTVCDVCGKIGPGTGTGVQFGAPLPLFANNVPVCVVSRWRQDVTGTVDVANGETAIKVGLFSDVYLTNETAVCPQCKNGSCTGGPNQGKACTVEAAQFPVYRNANATDRYDLSSTCVPSSPVATLRIDFDPLTSGTSGALNGDTPCKAKAGEPTGLPPKKDDCGAGGCAANNCTGTACVTMAEDPTKPGTMVCVDSKGGLSQACCVNKTNQPCFLRDASANITRTGKANPPQPPLPDTTYPKSMTGVLASTFCIPATGTNTIDTVTGLPGPGAILLNGNGSWTK